MRAFQTLGLQEINAIQFKAMIAMTAPSKGKQIMQVLRQLKGLSVTREKSIQMRRQLDYEDAKAFRQAEISIVETAFSDTEIRLGGGRLELFEDVAGQTFFLSDSGIEQRLRAES